jgi:hypothetical protein
MTIFESIEGLPASRKIFHIARVAGLISIMAAVISSLLGGLLSFIIGGNIIMWSIPLFLFVFYMGGSGPLWHASWSNWEKSEHEESNSDVKSLVESGTER